MKAFDSHFHLLPEVVSRAASFYNDAWSDYSGHLRAMDEAGVDKALISYPTTDYNAKKGLSEIRAAREYNELVGRLALDSGGRLAYLAAVPLTETDEMLAEAKRAAGEGAAGLSLPTNVKGVYPDEVRFHPFFAEVERMGLPVFIHPTTQTPFGHAELRHALITPVFQYAFDTMLCLAKVVDAGLLTKFPGLKLVFASFGGAMPFFAGRFDRTYAMLLERGIVKDLGEGPGDTLRKVYVDTSGSASATMLKLAVETFGCDRVLWGSDYPANREIAASIDAVKSLRVDKAVKQKLLWGNLDGLLGRG